MLSQITNLQQLRPTPACALCIGTFDGMHRGHLALLDLSILQAKKLGIASCVLSFDPPPKAHFNPNPGMTQLMSKEEKQDFINAYGITQWICLKFNQELAQMPAKQFVEHVLCQKLHSKSIIVGDDFHFGHLQQGDFQLLQNMSQKQDFVALQARTVQHQGRRISSSWLRQVLTDGDLKLASQLLGRPYSMQGIVQSGAQRGRQLGFPTANIDIKRQFSPLQGVFVVSTQLSWQGDTHHYYGVANLGCRPTIDGQQLLLEVHLFDYDGDLYGKSLKVDFLHKLRNEKTFHSLQALSEQINLDAKQGRAWIQHQT